MSKLADYGIALLLHATRDGAELHTARGLAEGAGLPLPTVSKILKCLTKAGVLLSHRGTRGGYSLARPAHAISIIDIIAAIDGPPALTACNEDPERRCVREAVCPTRANWQLINQRVLEALDDLKLADMAHPLAPPLVQLRGPRPERAAAQEKRT